jgi:DNA repair protein RadD
MTALAKMVGLELRDYQVEAVDSVVRIWEEDPASSPLIVAPTGSGKSVMVADLCRRFAMEHRKRVLCVIHVKELVAQNYKKFREHWPGADAGIFSASLGRKDRRALVTFANVQSIARVGEQFRNVGLLLIDEAHLLPHADDGQYRDLIKKLRLNNPDLKIVGLTATPWRLNSGNLCEPYGDQQPLFTEVAYEIPMTELLKRGYLCSMVARKPKQKMDVSGVHKRGGEFIEKELNAAVNTDEINRGIVEETIELCADRRSWLVFGVSIDHCTRLRDMFRERGVRCEVVSSHTPQHERDILIRDFIAGRIRCLTNVSILTTGFDYPGLDAIILARPTASPGLFLQMAGRGLRTADDKPNCLMLDFAGNTHRHGLITHVNGVHKKKREGEDTRDCPKCDTINERKAERCVNCGHVFQKGQAPDAGDREAKLSKSQTTDRVMAAWEEGIEGIVLAAHCKPHVARNTGINTLQVEYTLGTPDGQQIRVWQHVCIEHEGWAQKQARAWWRQRSRLPPPSTVAEAMSRLGELKLPKSLLVTRDGQWWRVESAKF